MRKRTLATQSPLSGFSIQILVNVDIFKVSLYLSLTHLRAQISCYEEKETSLSPIMFQEIFTTVIFKIPKGFAWRISLDHGWKNRDLGNRASPTSHMISSKILQRIQGLFISACEQGLRLGDIVKSRRGRGAREALERRRDNINCGGQLQNDLHLPIFIKMPLGRATLSLLAFLGVDSKLYQKLGKKLGNYSLPTSACCRE